MNLESNGQQEPSMPCVVRPNVQLQAGEESLMEKLECGLVLKTGKVGSMEKYIPD